MSKNVAFNDVSSYAISLVPFKLEFKFEVANEI